MAHKFLVTNPYTFCDVPIMGIASVAKPGTLQAHYLDTKYSGLSAHIHFRTFLYSVKPQYWTCSLVVLICVFERVFWLCFSSSYENEIRYVQTCN